jgi:hypothetical protein
MRGNTGEWAVHVVALIGIAVIGACGTIFKPLDLMP